MNAAPRTIKEMMEYPLVSAAASKCWVLSIPPERKRKWLSWFENLISRITNRNDIWWGNNEWKKNLIYLNVDCMTV
jgi:hypothetical protein